MKVALAETAGFCIGVRRALEMVLKAINENQPKIYTYGPLIHNPQVLELLRERGIKILKPGEEIPEGLVVIRAHGIPLPRKDCDLVICGHINLLPLAALLNSSSARLSPSWCTASTFGCRPTALPGNGWQA